MGTTTNDIKAEIAAMQTRLSEVKSGLLDVADEDQLSILRDNESCLLKRIGELKKKRLMMRLRSTSQSQSMDRDR